MSITSNANSTFLNVDNAHLRVSGDIHATSVKVGAIEIVPGYSLESTTGIGNTTPHTVEFTNTETSLVTSGDINMLHSSNNAAIKLNSNVVAEFPRSKKLIKYPRVALTQNALNNGYTVIQSGTYINESRKAWSLFNNDVTTDDQYHAVPVTGASYPYNSTTGVYQPTAGFENGLGDVAGDYVYVVMPDKIKLQGVRIHPRDSVLSRSAVSARFMGSNDETNWVDLGGYTDYVWGAGSQEPGNFFTVDSNEYYNCIGVVWTKLQGGTGGNSPNMAEVQFFGLPEYDPQADGTDVKVKSIPNVPNTDWLEVYYDAKNLEDGTTTVNDLKPVGTAVNGTVFGNTTVSDGAFTFDGSGDYIESQNITTLSGNQVMSSSVWVKFNSWINANVDMVFSLGDRTGGNGKEYALAAYHSGTAASTNGLYVSIYGYNAITSKVIPDLNNWYHFVTTHDGSNHQIFINGVLVTSSVSNGDVSLPTSGCDLVLGGDTSSTRAQFMNGSIANFRLFNRALTSDEVWQLYAYQKEYFGHGDLSMTFKAGRLGIGTSEPRAALDVRGDIIGGCPVAFSVAYNPNSLSGEQTIVWNLVYHNVGGGYNRTNGVFTAPVSGYYHFTVWGMTSGSGTGVVIELQFMKNGSVVQQRPYGSAGGNYGNATGSIIEYLRLGDTMSITLTSGTTLYATSSQSYNGFSGFYLSS